MWTSTLGGVVAWDLATRQPELYTTRDGLEEIQGNAIVSCPMPAQKIVVAHNTGGLSTYDVALKKWSRLPITFEDGATLTGVMALYCDQANHRLLVGASGGLGILDWENGRWKRFGPAEGLRVNTIRAIEVAGRSIWVAAGDQSAFLILGNTVFPYNGETGFPTGPVDDIAVAPDSSVWLGYPTGLVHYQNQRWNSYGTQSLAGIPFFSVDRVEIGPDKRIWIASASEGVCPFDPVSLSCATIYPSLKDAPVTALAVDPNGTAYAGTRGGGLLVLQQDTVQQLALHRNQLISNDVRDIAESTDGRLWIATGQGVNILDPAQPQQAWQTIAPERSKLLYPQVSGLKAVQDGMWLFYAEQPQASFFDGADWLQLDSKKLKEMTAPVLDAAIDPLGYIWFATGDGIRVWDGVVLRNQDPLARDWPGSRYQALLRQNDRMWAGTENGLWSYQRFQWRQVLSGMSINALAPGGESGLLLGTDQGLVRFDGSQSYLWIINLGDQVLIHPKVTAMAWDLKGHLWVGTDGEGLFQFDGTIWSQFNSATGLPTNYVRKILVDHLGAVWIATGTSAGGGALVRYQP